VKEVITVYGEVILEQHNEKKFQNSYRVIFFTGYSSPTGAVDGVYYCLHDFAVNFLFLPSFAILCIEGGRFWCHYHNSSRHMHL
jgi:hypothetical protein